MRSSALARKLVLAVLALFLVPTLVAGGVLLVLYQQGAFEDNPRALALAVAIGFVTMMVYLGTVTYTLGRSLVRTLEEIRLGAELMATVNSDHRLDVRTGDELEALAAEINRLADHLRDARTGLERQVARATHELTVEREKLSAVLAAVGEGIVLATPDGRVSLANRAAQELLGAGLLGRSLFEVVDREKVTHVLDRLRAGGRPVERFTLHAAGGGVLESVMTPFFDVSDEEQRMIGFLLVLRDVTRPARSDDARQRLLADALRELRGPLASIRSLSESLLADSGAAAGAGPAAAPGLATQPGRRLLQAIHAEALRLSGLVRELSEPARRLLDRSPWHVESTTVSDLAAMAQRRLGGDDLRVDTAAVAELAPSLPPLRAETSALSAALAHLLRGLLARQGAEGRAWLRPALRGRVLQLEAAAPARPGESAGATAAAAGTPGAPAAVVADLEALLDGPVAIGVAPGPNVREIVRQHAGEVWAFADSARAGFRLTLPAAEPNGAEPEPGADAGAARAATFVGAGTVSGSGGSEAQAERPDFYDFSLFEQVADALVPADRDRRLDELSCVVFDTETTGLDPDGGDRIVSIAGVRVRGGTVKRGETFDALVNPGRPIPAASTAFHGITDAMVAEAPLIDVVLPAFLRFAEGAVLVGHQVTFDLRFLEREAARLRLPPLAAVHPVLDTLLLSEVVHGPLAQHGLDAMATRLGVAIRGRHSALGDALVTAEIFVRLIELLKKRGIRTLGQAADAARRVRGPADSAAAPAQPGI